MGVVTTRSLVVCCPATAMPAWAATVPATRLDFGDGSAWRCLAGKWSGRDGGLILPPETRNLHSRAFHVGKAFGDVTVEFEYWGGYRESATGTAGLTLRAADAGHFYWVHFPWCGQPYRSKHFWAGLGAKGPRRCGCGPAEPDAPLIKRFLDLCARYGVDRVSEGTALAGVHPRLQRLVRIGG